MLWYNYPSSTLSNGEGFLADILLLIPIGFAPIQHGASVPVVQIFMIAAAV